MTKENNYVSNKIKLLNEIKSYTDFFISIGVLSDITLILNRVININSKNWNNNEEVILISSIASLSVIFSIITNYIYKEEYQEYNKHCIDATNALNKKRIKNM